MLDPEKRRPDREYEPPTGKQRSVTDLTSRKKRKQDPSTQHTQRGLLILVLVLTAMVFYLLHRVAENNAQIKPVIPANTELRKVR